MMDVLRMTQGMKHLLDAECIISRAFLSDIPPRLMREVVSLKEVSVIGLIK